MSVVDGIYCGCSDYRDTGGGEFLFMDGVYRLIYGESMVIEFDQVSGGAQFKGLLLRESLLFVYVVDEKS